MKSFSDFNIQLNSNRLLGDKIKIAKVLNQHLIVHSYRLEDSKYSKNKSGKCLFLQIEFDNERRVVFTGSDILINQIEKVPPDGFPFACRIVKEGESYMFS